MANDHIAIPKLIQKQFSHKGKVFTYRHSNHTLKSEGIDTLGTEDNHYEKYIEKKILSSLESKFANFLLNFLKEQNLDVIPNLFNENIETITVFLNLLYFRSTKALDDNNRWSIYSRLIKPLSHSEFIQIANSAKISFLKFVGDNYQIIPFVNFTKIRLINNSLGFAIIKRKDNFFDLFYPLSPTRGIYVTSKMNEKGNFYYSDNDNVIKIFNKNIAYTEIAFGIGYIFAEYGIDLLPNLPHYEKTFLDLKDNSNC